MADTPQTSPRLDELRRRWEDNPGSRVFLQLSEEYRSLDRTAEAAAILEQGLAQRPTDVGALVALGRCRLELSDPEGAIEVLERVLAIDPAHLVANKHLVDAHLRRNDAARARDRLGFYRLLNDRDPELDHFAYRLSRLEQESGAVTSDEAVSDGVEGADDPSAGAVDLADEVRAADTVATEGVASESSDDNGGGVFRPSAEPFGVLPPLDRATSGAVLDDGPFDLLALLTPTDDDPRDASEADVAAVDAAEADTDTEAEADTSTEAEADTDIAAESEMAAASEPAGEDAAVEAGAVDEDDEDTSQEVPATVALASIYEEQGYKQDAIRVLQRVLEQEPENREAWERLTVLTASAETAPDFTDGPASVEEEDSAAVAEAEEIESEATEEIEMPEGVAVVTPDPEALTEALQPDEAIATAMAASEPDEDPEEALAPDDVAPDEVASADVAPDDVAPAEVAPDEVASADVAPADVAPDEEAVVSQPAEERPVGVTARKIDVLERYLATIRAARGKLEGDHVH